MSVRSPQCEPCRSIATVPAAAIRSPVSAIRCFSCQRSGSKASEHGSDYVWTSYCGRRHSRRMVGRLDTVCERPSTRRFWARQAGHQTVHFTDVFRQCTCTSTQVPKYQKKISAPPRPMPRLKRSCALRNTDHSTATLCSTCSPLVHRSAQAEDTGPKEIRAYCKPSDEVKNLLRAAIQQLGLSARAYDRLLKVSRTIADLEGVKDIQVAHVAEAIQYRSLDRKFLGSKLTLSRRSRGRGSAVGIGNMPGWAC